MFAYFLNIGTPEMIIILVIAVILFGKRLPEVGRSVGKSIVEFKKGMRGVEEEISRATYSPDPPRMDARLKEEVEQPTAPKFDPPPSPASPDDTASRA